MEKQPLITLITVSYNAAGVIDKTLESLKRQTYKDFEYLVIDGASKDGTQDKVIKADIPGTVMISEPDKGLYDAMNKGLKKARGKYVLFLNAGDAFHDAGTLALYAEAAHGNADIIYGDTDIVNHKGERISPRHLNVPEKLDKKSFADGMLICHQAFMVRKDLTSPYVLEYHFSADYDWCVKCIASSDDEKCVNLHRVTIDYLSEGLTDKNKWKSLRERFRIMARHYGYFPTLIRHLGFLSRALQRGHL